VEVAHGPQTSVVATAGEWITASAEGARPRAGGSISIIISLLGDRRSNFGPGEGGGRLATRSRRFIPLSNMLLGIANDESHELKHIFCKFSRLYQLLGFLLA
jgi:hypothetical protein